LKNGGRSQYLTITNKKPLGNGTREKPNTLRYGGKADTKRGVGSTTGPGGRCGAAIFITTRKNVTLLAKVPVSTEEKQPFG